MAREAFASWAPFLALGCGILAGLGRLHSAKRVFGLAVVLVLIQMAAWTAIFTIAEVEPHEKAADWNTTLGAAFLVSLLVALPYTVIGAVLSGTAVGLLRRRARRNRGDVFCPPGHLSGHGDTGERR